LEDTNGEQTSSPLCVIAPVGDQPGEPIGDADATLCLGQQHHAAVRGDSSAIKDSAHVLIRYRWQVEGQRDILIDQGLPLYERRALLLRSRGSCRTFWFRAMSSTASAK
jgi:hypothetical protein